MCMLACWVEDPNGDCFKKHLARVKEYIWVAEDGIKMHVSTHFFFFLCVCVCTQNLSISPKIGFLGLYLNFFRDIAREKGIAHFNI